MGLFIKTDVLAYLQQTVNLEGSTFHAHITYYKTSQHTVALSYGDKHFKRFIFPFVRRMMLGRAVSLMAPVLIT